MASHQGAGGATPQPPTSRGTPATLLPLHRKAATEPAWLIAKEAAPGRARSPGPATWAMLLLGSPAHRVDGRLFQEKGRARYVRLWTRSTRPPTYEGTPATLHRYGPANQTPRPRGGTSGRGVCVHGLRTPVRSTQNSADGPSGVTASKLRPHPTGHTPEASSPRLRGRDRDRGGGSRAPPAALDPLVATRAHAWPPAQEAGGSRRRAGHRPHPCTGHLR